MDSVAHLDVKLHQRSSFAASDIAKDFDVLENIFNDGCLSNDGCTIAWIRPCSPSDQLTCSLQQKKTNQARQRECEVCSSNIRTS